MACDEMVKISQNFSAPLQSARQSPDLSLSRLARRSILGLNAGREQVNFGGAVGGGIGIERAEQFPGNGGTALTRRRPVSAEGRDQLGGNDRAVVGPVPEGRNQLIGHLGTARHVGKHLFEFNGHVGEVSSF